MPDRFLAWRPRFGCSTPTRTAPRCGAAMRRIASVTHNPNRERRRSPRSSHRRRVCGGRSRPPTAARLRRRRYAASASERISSSSEHGAADLPRASMAARANQSAIPEGMGPALPMGMAALHSAPPPEEGAPPARRCWLVFYLVGAVSAADAGPPGGVGAARAGSVARRGRGFGAGQCAIVGVDVTDRIPTLPLHRQAPGAADGGCVTRESGRVARASASGCHRPGRRRRGLSADAMRFARSRRGPRCDVGCQGRSAAAL